MNFRRRLSALIIPLALFLFVFCFASSFSEKMPRQYMALTTWQFVGDAEPLFTSTQPPKKAQWKEVSVPHVFRQSGLPDNAAGWYRQIVNLSAADRHRSVYLMMEGAASVKDVYVNGAFIGRHRGAFSASAFDLTPALKIGHPNTLDVRVTNRDEETQNCFSRSTLYYVNGGMFRKAWLVKTGEVHIYPDMGSSGVYLTPKIVSGSEGSLATQTFVRNPLSMPVQVIVRHSVKDPNGASCAQFDAAQILLAGATTEIKAAHVIEHPMLWDMGRPNLYTVRTELIVDGRVSDVVTERIGFRTIEAKNSRFLLNGREVQFRGVNKHAQNEYAWNAVSDDELRSEWKLIAELGANMVRLAHYPHSRLEYDIADERGMVVWAENGYAGQIWKGPGNEEKSFMVDGKRLTREMVRQNWNHPSILFWSAGNETILETAGQYADIIRQERDPTRLVTYAATGDQQLKNCDFVAYNTYDGWYTGGPYTDFTKSPHNDMVAETGSGDWITHHIPYGLIQFTVDQYEPEEYSEVFTEYRLQTVSRDDIANHPMFLWWNFREFYNLKFKQNRNTKGLLTLAGMPKDVYFLFKAFLNPTVPVVHLCGRHHFLRAFDSDNGIKAYSNAEELQLTLNGVVQEKIKNGRYRLPDDTFKNTQISGIPTANVFFWKAPLKRGRNVIEVSDGRGHSDRMVVYQKASDMRDAAALVQDVQSSNPENPAYFINRPVESQGPVYIDVDGSSDNTFDILPKEVEGAAWIATRRMSDPNLKTDLEFRINPASKGATIFVLFATGDYPTVTLKQPDLSIQSAANSMRKALAAAGFKSSLIDVVWRDHMLNRAGAELWRRILKRGKKIRLPGQTLDYVVLIKKQR
jgi:beta-galactosidase